MERAASFRDKDRLALMKKVFDEVALDVKKAVVRCEMPEFPEGCKGRTFREIYQLNARVRSVFVCVRTSCLWWIPPNTWHIFRSCTSHTSHS